MSLAPLVAAGPLRFGASGDAVRQIQLALKQIGYSLTGTGWFGPATDTAVETFQKRAGLVVDVGNAVLARALQYVLDHSPAWLQSWMGGPEQIAQKIIARLNLAPDAVPDAAAATSKAAQIQQILAK